MSKRKTTVNRIIYTAAQVPVEGSFVVAKLPISGGEGFWSLVEVFTNQETNTLVVQDKDRLLSETPWTEVLGWAPFIKTTYTEES